MSDLSMYELEDIVWDDFNQGDDHIVPHPANARTSRSSFEGDSCKKPRCETSPVLRNSDNLDASNTICQGKSERDSKPVNKKKNMMEKELPSHGPPTGTSGDNTPNTYPLTHISSTEDLRFVYNNCEDKEPGDLLCYGWPDIGNLDDVDKMLRSCDSSFGLGVTNNDDELDWFTSDQSKGTEEPLKMDFKFPCPEPSSLKHILQHHDSPESNTHRCIFENKTELNYKDQIGFQKKQSKQQNQTEGKNEKQSVGNDGSFYQISDLTCNNSRLSSNDKFDQVFTSVANGNQYNNFEVDYFGQTQSNISYLPPHYPHQTTAGPNTSDIKSDPKGLKSPSLMGSSYASNQGYSTESSGDHLYDGIVAEIDERQQAYDSQEFQPLLMRSSRQAGRMFQSLNGVLVSAEKQKELESQSDMEGVQKGSEIGSLKAPESSSVSSVLDEISLEASSFRQLQQVMIQLDLKTKLCIRDSLYRLARSAEQRHNNPSLSSSATDVNDVGGPLLAERTETCTGFMDMETDTNPIDRSVAHLLFHRPSESSKLAAPLLPQLNLNHGSVPAPLMMAKKLDCQEEATAGLNEKMDGY